MIYETKGLTLEQVDELYDEVKVARQSPGWQPKGSNYWTEVRASVAGQGGLGGAKRHAETDEKVGQNEYRSDGAS